MCWHLKSNTNTLRAELEDKHNIDTDQMKYGCKNIALYNIGADSHIFFCHVKMFPFWYYSTFLTFCGTPWKSP